MCVQFADPLKTGGKPYDGFTRISFTVIGLSVIDKVNLYRTGTAKRSIRTRTYVGDW